MLAGIAIAVGLIKPSRTARQQNPERISINSKNGLFSFIFRHSPVYLLHEIFVVAAIATNPVGKQRNCFLIGFAAILSEYICDLGYKNMFIL